MAKTKSFLFDITSGIDNHAILLEFIGYLFMQHKVSGKLFFYMVPIKYILTQLVEYFLNSSLMFHLGLGELNKRFAATVV